MHDSHMGKIMCCGKQTFQHLRGMLLFKNGLSVLSIVNRYSCCTTCTPQCKGCYRTKLCFHLAADNCSDGTVHLASCVVLHSEHPFAHLQDSVKENVAQMESPSRTMRCQTTIFMIPLQLVQQEGGFSWCYRFLYNFGSIAYPLCASVSSSVKWGC